MNKFHKMHSKLLALCSNSGFNKDRNPINTGNLFQTLLGINKNKYHLFKLY